MATGPLELWVWHDRHRGGEPDQRIPLPVGSRLVVGRSPDADVRVPSPHLARRHFEVRRDETGVWLTDLGSLSGVWLNGRQTRGPSPVSVSDSITQADMEIRLVPVGVTSSPSLDTSAFRSTWGGVVANDAPEVDDRLWERPGAFRLDCEPHRSGLLLALGKVSLALGIASWFLLFPALPGLLLGLSALLLSWRDLKVMRSGLMDQVGERQTRRATHAALAGVALSLVGGYFLCRHLFWFFTD